MRRRAICLAAALRSRLGVALAMSKESPVTRVFAVEPEGYDSARCRLKRARGAQPEAGATRSPMR